MKGFFPSSKVQRDRPASIFPRCATCGLYRTCRSPKMEPYGQGRKGVLVVGEAPGQTEDEEGRPFIGKAGQFLRQVMRDSGLNLDKDAITTNALICRPPKNKTPSSEQVGFCRPNVLNLIKEMDPRVIITLGRSALESVIGPHWRDVETLERWVGWKIPLDGRWICPTYHPSYLLRMRNQLLDRIFTEHLEQAFDIEEDAPPPLDFESKIEVLFDENHICRALKEMEGWIAIDYETNCLKPEYPKARIISCAVSDGKRTISYPWIGKAISSTRSLLEKKRTKKIASNLKFEDRWTRFVLKTDVNNWGWDTMVAAHCLDNRPDICSIKFQAFIRLGVPSYNENIAPYLSNSKGHYNRIEEIDMSDLLLYGGMDALLEYKVAMAQRSEMGYED